jgi:hypothetical protein
MKKVHAVAVETVDAATVDWYFTPESARAAFDATLPVAQDSEVTLFEFEVDDSASYEEIGRRADECMWGRDYEPLMTHNYGLALEPVGPQLGETDDPDEEAGDEGADEAQELADLLERERVRPEPVPRTWAMRTWVPPLNAQATVDSYRYWLDESATIQEPAMRADAQSRAMDAQSRAMEQARGYQITAEIFRNAMGSDPSTDDLERCNCSSAGAMGHEFCGWDYSRNLPRFAIWGR